MRLTISITVALLLFAGIAMAADVPTMKGDKAMVFMFDGLANLDLDTYHGGLGMRYYFADYMAIRGGLMFDMGSETEEACSDAPSGYPDEEDSWSDLGIEIVFEKHLFHCDKPAPLTNAVNCYASPSPAIEPGRAYVNFGRYGTACTRWMKSAPTTTTMTTRIWCGASTSRRPR